MSDGIAATWFGSFIFNLYVIDPSSVRPIDKRLFGTCTGSGTRRNVGTNEMNGTLYLHKMLIPKSTVV